MRKLKIAFVCVHNSCRSQMAEAITKKLASDLFEPYSAGTETKPQINQDAVRIIEQLYNVNMNETQKSKLLDDIPQELDVLITMGCNVECPFIPTQHREDWGLDDPSGLSDEAFLLTAKLIKEKLLLLKEKIESREIEIKE
jgi:arsenate reductase